ncbi:uncharacterized protein LOC126678330 [Mercurialis annua]|uniref:uncharacterized protein LOC126678330 n=1 Tax=Mercurialis annua TaxID=3986 RepID=UPI00215E0B87|nr:uncharacterized protein LOC126678330 [Mercurialis annua]
MTTRQQQLTNFLRTWSRTWLTIDLEMHSLLGIKRLGGFLSHRKQCFIRNLLGKLKLSFIDLLEQKKDHIDAFLVRKLWPILDFDFDFVPSTGASGGLLLIWNSARLNNISVMKGDRWICLEFFFNSHYIQHILIYASNLASKISSLWAVLLPLTCFSDMVFITGEFNKILTSKERLNCVGFSASMLALQNFLNESKLIDLPLQGHTFTWRNSYSKSRIDRIFAFILAANTWSSLSLFALPNRYFDHAPLLLQSDLKIE